MIFGVPTVAPGILSLTELADGFRRLIQPFTICQKCHQFNGAEKLYSVLIWPALWLNFSGSDQ
jgi:hypothetical protein